MKTGRRDLVANRWEPFVHTMDFEGVDWSAAAFAAQVRPVKDTSGAAAIDLATVALPTAEGIAVTGFSALGSGGPLTSISIRINEATMEALPLPAVVGTDLVYYWDLQVTPVGGSKVRILEGTFTIKAGVTH